MSHTEHETPRNESLRSFASAMATAPAAARDTHTFCAWRGSLPWHVHPQTTLQQLLERSGAEPSQSHALAQRFAAGTFVGPHAHRDLIEWRALTELAHGFVAHTDHWFVRFTQNQARSALTSLIDLLHRNKGYELAVTRSELPWSIVLRQSRSAEMWGAQEQTGIKCDSMVSRSKPLVSTLASYFEGVWNDHATLRERHAVLDLLTKTRHAIEHRRIF